MASTKATGLLSKNIKLYYSESENGTYTELLDLQEVPDLGGAADKVDVTTLADGNYRYINGIKDFGDLAFTFLYSAERYEEVNDLVDKDTFWKVTFPDGANGAEGTAFTFAGQASISTVGAGVNAALQFTLTINLTSDIDIAFA